MATALSASSRRRKLGLLIGNNNYQQKENILRHCINDADDLGDVLRKIDFRVTIKHDLAKKQMVETIKNFKNSVVDGDLVLFFFSGHGRHVNGINYMIPVDDNGIITNEDVEDNAVKIDALIERFSQQNPSYANIFILDCCRVYRPDSTPKSKDGSAKTDDICHGLTPVVGAYVHFACGLNQKAWDGFNTDRNGLFTTHLRKHIATPNVDIYLMFNKVTADVCLASKRKQIPSGWNGLMLSEHIYLNEKSQPDIHELPVNYQGSSRYPIQNPRNADVLSYQPSTYHSSRQELHINQSHMRQQPQERIISNLSDPHLLLESQSIYRQPHTQQRDVQYQPSTYDSSRQQPHINQTHMRQQPQERIISNLSDPHLLLESQSSYRQPYTQQRDVQYQSSSFVDNHQPSIYRSAIHYPSVNDRYISQRGLPDLTRKQSSTNQSYIRSPRSSSSEQVLHSDDIHNNPDSDDQNQVPSSRNDDYRNDSRNRRYTPETDSYNISTRTAAYDYRNSGATNPLISPTRKPYHYHTTITKSSHPERLTRYHNW